MTDRTVNYEECLSLDVVCRPCTLGHFVTMGTVGTVRAVVLNHLPTDCDDEELFDDLAERIDRVVDALIPKDIPQEQRDGLKFFALQKLKGENGGT